MTKNKVINSQPITIPKVKALLQSLGEENLDQFQRRSLDYASKFSKLSSDKVAILLEELSKYEILNEEEAVQIVNCMPQTINELRIFLAGGRKIIEILAPSQMRPPRSPITLFTANAIFGMSMPACW